MKKLILSAAAATALAFTSMSALANVPYDPDDFTYLGAFTAGQSETFSRGPLANGTVIDDYWIFDFSPDGSASFSINFNPQSTITGIVGQLFAVTTNQACVVGQDCASTIGGLVPGGTATTTAGNTQLDFTNINTGRYAVYYAGTVVNTSNDTNYTGQINFRSRAVPEPGTLALLGLGLAGIGLARRRKQ